MKELIVLLALSITCGWVWIKYEISEARRKKHEPVVNSDGSVTRIPNVKSD